MALKNKSSREAKWEAEQAKMRKNPLCFNPSLQISSELVEKYRGLVANEGNENGPPISSTPRPRGRTTK